MHLTFNRETKCVMARIMRAGQKHQKNFTLKKFGSWNEAETAAEQWTQEMLDILPPPHMGPGPQEKKTRRNNSGVVGVWLTPKYKQSPHDVNVTYEYWSWVARWPGCRYSGGLPWSINKFGDADAFVLAVLARRLESTDRETLLELLEQIKSTSEYEEILNSKNLFLL